MKLFPARLIFYINIYFYIIKLNIKQELIYKINFIGNIIINLGYFFINLVFYKILYTAMQGIEGWSIYDLYLLVATCFLVDSCYYCLFDGSLAKLSDKVITGELDFDLLKPVKPIFSNLFTCFSWQSIFSIFTAVFIILIVIVTSNFIIYAKDILLYIAMLFLAIWARTIFSIIISTGSFYTGENMAIRYFFNSFMEFSRWPANIFPSFGKIIFTFFLPVLLIANYPLNVLLGKNSMRYFFIILFWNIIFSLIAVFFWKKSLKRYEGASS